MKIGVLGPDPSIQMFLKATVQNAVLAEMISLPCTLDDVGATAAEWQGKLDGLLFTGFLPYMTACRKVSPRIPWEYLSRTTTSVLEALLRISHSTGCDISKISYDLQENASEEFLVSLLEGVGISRERSCVYCFRSRAQLLYRRNDYNEKALAFHMDNLRSGRARVCLTGIEEIQQQISAAGFPAVWIQPSKESMMGQLNALLLRCKTEQGKNPAGGVRPFVMAVSIQERSATGDLEQGEFAHHCISNAVAEHLYHFAQRNGAAVEYHESATSYLYLQQSWLNHEELIALIQRLCKKLCGTDGVAAAFLGVGSGATIGLAKACAQRGRQLAEVQKLTCYYILERSGPNEILTGPFTYEKKEKAVMRSKIMERLEQISKESGLGIGTLKTICDVTEEYDIEITTVRELAGLCSMTNSYLNRILCQLEDAGYAETVGRRPVDGPGRPQRLLRLKLRPPED